MSLLYAAYMNWYPIKQNRSICEKAVVRWVEVTGDIKLCESGANTSICTERIDSDENL
jgi:hypothetical protein